MKRPFLGFGFRSRLGVLLSILALGAVGSACKSSNSYPTRDASTTPVLKGDAGAVQITGSSNNCPVVTIVASPPDAKVGEQIDVRVTASDPDPGAQLTYAWSAAAGAFGDATLTHTKYNCLSNSVGPQTITIAVSDGQCTTTQQAQVYCFATAVQGTGGAGGRGAGGAGGTGGTTSNGTGGVSGGTGGSAAGGTTGTGGSGMGGTTGTGGSNGQTCNGIVSHDQFEGAACDQCTVDNCFPSTDGCQGDPKNPPAGVNSDSRIRACLNLYCCIRANRCAVGGIPTNCWCGSTSFEDCITNKSPANGPCKAEFQAAAESMDPATIKLRFVDPGYPIGLAVNLAQCRGMQCGTPPEGGGNGECSIP